MKSVKCLCVKCLVRMSSKSVITCVSDTYVYNAKEYPPYLIDTQIVTIPHLTFLFTHGTFRGFFRRKVFILTFLNIVCVFEVGAINDARPLFLSR